MEPFDAGALRWARCMDSVEEPTVEVGVRRWFGVLVEAGALAMMRPRQGAPGALFYEFTIDDHVPEDHLLRRMERFVDLSEIRGFLAPFYRRRGEVLSLLEFRLGRRPAGR